MSALTLPDPRALDGGERRALEEGFRRLTLRPLVETPEGLESAERQALDELVFDLVGLSAAERSVAREALIDCLIGRRQRAKHVSGKGS